MNTMIHPTHAKVTRMAMLACLMVTVVGFIAAFFVEYAISQLCIGIAMVGGALFLLLAAVRAKVCRCPQCKSWLFRQVKVDTDTEPRVFVCSTCNVAWNSEVVLSFGGD